MMFALFFLLLVTFCHAQTMLYVSGTNGNDANNCSVQFPCMSLKGALNASYEYYNNSQNLFITFSEGIYSGKDNINITLPENYNITISSNSDETSTIFQCDSTYSYGFKASEINVFSVNKISIKECHLGIDHPGKIEFQININQAIFSKNAYSIYSQARNVKISNSQFIDGNITTSNQYSVYFQSKNIQIESTTFKNVPYVHADGQTSITDCVFDSLERSSENIMSSGNITIQNSFFNSSLVGTCIEMYEDFTVISIQNSTIINCFYPVSMYKSSVDINIFDSTFKNFSRFELEQSAQFVNSVFVGSINDDNESFDNVVIQSYSTDNILIDNCNFSNLGVYFDVTSGIIKNSEFSQLVITFELDCIDLNGNWVLDSNFFHDIFQSSGEMLSISASSMDSIVVTNCTFKNINIEDSVLLLNGAVEVSNCNFSNITSNYEAILIYGIEILNITNSKFEYITGSNSIYLSAQDANIYISDCIFYNIVGDLPALKLYTYRSIFIDNSIFSQNINNQSFGGAIEAGGFSYFYVQNSQFSRNIAYDGGAIELYNQNGVYTLEGTSVVQIYNTSFTDNIAQNGPVLHCSSNNFDVSFSSSTMDGNVAYYNSGNVYCFPHERNTTAIWVGVSISVAVILCIIFGIVCFKRRKQDTAGFDTIN